MGCREGSRKEIGKEGRREGGWGFGQQTRLSKIVYDLSFMGD